MLISLPYQMALHSGSYNFYTGCRVLTAVLQILLLHIKLVKKLPVPNQVSKLVSRSFNCEGGQNNLSASSVEHTKVFFPTICCQEDFFRSFLREESAFIRLCVRYHQNILGREFLIFKVRALPRKSAQRMKNLWIPQPLCRSLLSPSGGIPSAWGGRARTVIREDFIEKQKKHPNIMVF